MRTNHTLGYTTKVALAMFAMCATGCFGMIVKNRALWITAACVDEFPIQAPLEDVRAAVHRFFEARGMTVDAERTGTQPGAPVLTIATEQQHTSTTKKTASFEFTQHAGTHVEAHVYQREPGFHVVFELVTSDGRIDVFQRRGYGYQLTVDFFETVDREHLERIRALAAIRADASYDLANESDVSWVREKLAETPR